MADRSLSSAFYLNSAGQRRMKIAAVEFGAGISWNAPTDDLEKVWQKWEDYVKAKLAAAPAGLKNGFQTSAAWAWMDTVKQMQSGAYIAAGTTLGMMIANVPAIFLGHELLKRVDLAKVRMVAAALFLVIGLWVLVQTAGWLG